MATPFPHPPTIFRKNQITLSKSLSFQSFFYLCLINKNSMKTLHRFFIILVFSASAGYLFGQAPQWTSYTGRELVYPHEFYYTGFAERQISKKDDVNKVIEILRNDALTLLTESIEVTVQSETSQYAVESGNNVEEHFMVSSATSSNLTLSGVKFETCHDKKADKAFALAFVSRNDLTAYYSAQLQHHLERLDELVKTASGHAAANRREQALQAWYDCMPVLKQAEEALALLIIFGGSNDTNYPVKELREAITAGFFSLKNSISLSMAEAAAFLADGIKQQVKSPAKPVLLSNFTYRDTRMASPFSRKFSQVLEQKLTAKGFRVLTEMPSSSTSTDLLVMKGTYWDETDLLKLIVVLKDLKTSETVAGMDIAIDKQKLASENVDYLPQNFQQAMADQHVFMQDELVGGGLLLECWTDRGTGSPIYVSGEKMKIFVRVNQPAYLRLIYFLADGNKNLLFDQYYIDESKVNKAVEIPQQFLCTEPFGVETLQVLAQSETFPALKTQKVGGYLIIMDNTKNLLMKTRGMMTQMPTDLKAEKRIVITTMKE